MIVPPVMLAAAAEAASGLPAWVKLVGIVVVAVGFALAPQHAPLVVLLA